MTAKILDAYLPGSVANQVKQENKDKQEKSSEDKVLVVIIGLFSIVSSLSSASVPCFSWAKRL